MLTSDFPILDLGNQKEGIKVEKGFTIYNKTDHTIKVTGSNSSCGCTVASIQKGDLLPGNSMRVAFEFNTKNRKGYQKKSVYVLYEEDGKKLQFDQPFKCNVL